MNNFNVDDCFQGAQKISPFPPVEDLVAQLLKLLCDQTDPERAWVNFNKDDDIVLLLDNYGGLSKLELGALTQETLARLGMLAMQKASCNMYTDPA